MHIFPVSWSRGYDHVKIFGVLEKDAFGEKAQEFPKASCLIVKKVTTKVLIDLGRSIEPWTEAQLGQIKKFVYEKLAESSSNNGFTKRGVTPLSWTCCKKRVMMGSHLVKGADGKFVQREWDFIEVEFASNNSAFDLQRILDQGIEVDGRGDYKKQFFKIRDNFELWYQLMIRKGLNVASWFWVDEPKQEYDQMTLCEEELSCNVDDLYLAKSKLPIPKIPAFVFDIEAYASQPNSFPKAENIDDRVFQISCVFGRNAYLLTRWPVDNRDLESRFPNYSVSVIQVKSEHELLTKFVELIRQLCPLITVGYNNMQFDMPYMLERSEMLSCSSEFSMQTLSINLPAKKRELKWSSAARPDQQFTYLNGEGISTIDLYSLIFADFKLSSYKLGEVGNHFGLGSKDDLPAQSMFRLYEQSQKAPNDPVSIRGMTRVGAYCLRDTILTKELFEKLNYVEYCVCLADVTNCQITELATRGTQYKTEQNLMRFCFEENRVFDGETQTDPHAGSFKGACVLDPISGRYVWITSLDFTALYPSLIRAHNLCPTTLVINPEVPDDQCEVLEWDDHQKCKDDERWTEKQQAEIDLAKSRDEVSCARKNVGHDKVVWNKYIEAKRKVKRLGKYKPDKTFCAHHKFRWFKGIEGVFPRVLKKLLDKRAQVRVQLNEFKKELKSLESNGAQDETTLASKEELKRWIVTLNAQQLVCKVQANSMYGFAGSKTSKLPCVPVAMCTTYTGRLALEKAKKIVEEQFDGKVIYGDSVSKDTPVFVREESTGLIHLKEIQDVCTEWIMRPDGKEQGYPVGWQVWSNEGWVPCRSVIRHKTKKQMYRVCANAGAVDVTQDHSLLSPEGIELKPNEVSIGTRLMTRALPITTNLCTSVSIKQARQLGFLFANNIINGLKAVPLEIINSPVEIQKEFLNAYLNDRNWRDNWTESKKGTIGSAGLYYVANQCGYSSSVGVTDRLDIFRLTLSKNPRNERNSIKKIIKLPPTDDYVFDIEANGKFSAGVGELVVHNTELVNYFLINLFNHILIIYFSSIF